MHDSELYFEKDKMSFLQFHELGEYQQMPVLIFDKKKKDEIGFKEFLDLYCSTEVVNKQVDLRAETMFFKEIEFNNIKDKKLIYGVQMDSERLGSQREELWEAEGELMFCKVNSFGYFEVDAEGITMDKIDEMKRGLKSMEFAGVKVTEYRTLEERDAIK